MPDPTRTTPGLFGSTATPARQARRCTPAAGEPNRLAPEDRAVHDWYRFVLSFPPHLVGDYLRRFAVPRGGCVLDPFCGTGTTLVECKKLGLRSIGLEANPMAAMASRVKVSWDVDPSGLEQHAREVAQVTEERLRDEGITEGGGLFAGARPGSRPTARLMRLPDGAARLLLANSISPLPLHKALLLLETLNARRDERFGDHELLALAKALVSPISNLHFGPEVGVGKPKSDAPVVVSWLDNVCRMACDIRTLCGTPQGDSTVYPVDSREIPAGIPPRSVDAVITSPPYPNEKDYTRTTRLESVLLGLIRDRRQLQALKRNLIRSNTRNVYKGDDDDKWIASLPQVHRLAEQIEARRIALGKTSGFERMYAKVTRLYFGGMARHLEGLKHALKPGAMLAYVVGDQASYLRVMIRTGKVLAAVAGELGYQLVGIDLFRTRLATATRQKLREEVVVLRWPGD
jgi:hypothetical protein